MTFEANTASTVTKAVNEAVQHIITIINNCTKKRHDGHDQRCEYRCE